MILESINILKLSSRSLVKHSHLSNPQSHSFMQVNNEIQSHPALNCLAKYSPGITLTHVSQFLSSPGRVNDPTPVLSDTCFSQPIRRERETLLAWNKSGLYLRNHNTWLICLCVSVCQCSPLLYLIHWHTGEEGLIKGNYSLSPGLETWPKRLSKFKDFSLILP